MIHLNLPTSNPGIGLEGHESPYLVGGSKDIILTGHTFSDEPGVYIEGEVRTRMPDTPCILRYRLRSAYGSKTASTSPTTVARSSLLRTSDARRVHGSCDNPNLQGKPSLNGGCAPCSQFNKNEKHGLSNYSLRFGVPFLPYQPLAGCQGSRRVAICCVCR